MELGSLHSSLRCRGWPSFTAAHVTPPCSPCTAPSASPPLDRAPLWCAMPWLPCLDSLPLLGCILPCSHRAASRQIGPFGLGLGDVSSLDTDEEVGPAATRFVVASSVVVTGKIEERDDRNWGGTKRNLWEGGGDCWENALPPAPHPLWRFVRIGFVWDLFYFLVFC